MANTSRYRFAIALRALAVVLAPPSAATIATATAAPTASSGHAANAAVGTGSAGTGVVPADQNRTLRTPERESIVVTQSHERTTDDGYLIVTVDASRVTDVANYGDFVVSPPNDARVISSSNLSDSALRGRD